MGDKKCDRCDVDIISFACKKHGGRCSATLSNIPSTCESHRKGGSRVKCCLPFCKTFVRRNAKRDVHFYAVGPIRKRNPERFQQWENAATSSHRTLLDSELVCSMHFNSDDFLVTDVLQRRLMPLRSWRRAPRLKPNAVPRIMETASCHDATTKQLSPHTVPGHSVCSRASETGYLHQFAATRVATCPHPEPCESQLTSDIKIEPENLESSLDLEMSPLSKMKQEDELKQETCFKFNTPSDCKIHIKQEYHENFQQQCETKNDIYFNSTTPSDWEIPECCIVKQEYHEKCQQESEIKCETCSEFTSQSYFPEKQDSCDLIQQAEIKEEKCTDFIPPETIFLQEHPISDELSTENDRIKMACAQSLSQMKNEKVCSNIPQSVLEKIPEICTQYFGTKTSINVHVERKHSGKRNSHQLQEFYDHLCKYHVKTFEFRNKILAYSLLIELAISDHHSFTCLECGVVYPDKEILCSHFKSVHALDRNREVIRCKLCLKCHNDFATMESHLKQNHYIYWNHCVIEDIRYCCTKCDELFAKCKDDPIWESSIKINDIEIFRIYYDGGFKFRYKIIGTFKGVSTNYACTVCKPTTFFTTENNLSTHLDIHDDFAFENCAAASHNFANINKLYQHYISLKCCKSDAINFENHDMRHAYGYQISRCSVCYLELVNSCCLAMHKQAVHRGTKFDVRLIDGKLTCPFCKVIFSDHKLFYAHCSPYTILFPNSSRHCEKCSVLFSTSSEFKQHCITKHNDHNCFKCQICNFGKESKAQLETHVLKEHNVQLIHCTNCLSNLKIRDKLTMEHFKKCCKSSELCYSCPVCGLLLDSFKSFIDHINFDILMLQTKVHQCKHCLNYFFSKYNLCAHLVNGKCQLCQLYFCGKAKLAEHTASQQCVPVKFV